MECKLKAETSLIVAGGVTNGTEREAGVEDRIFAVKANDHRRGS
ncbi:hypothetical protein [Rhodopirellula sp. P2]|nr:hypothetical protein [Rhodopirellula sp. P2]WDQ15086.1 hypothetical protein PSR62_15730 [Rhodopirellula sp. P2]